jgi:hypothetical protein
MTVSIGIGSVDEYVVDVVYSKRLRLFRIIVDARNVYGHCRLLPWAARMDNEIETAGPKVHTLKVEPPYGRRRRPNASNYLIRFDGQGVTRGVIN